jgi:hypothetical protein
MSHKSSILVLVFILCVLGAVTGYRYYKYVNKDPDFCVMCHVTEEGYRSWETSDHHLIICQTCHKLSVIEGNKLLLAYYVKGAKDVKQKHGRVMPWESCIACHNREAAQGSVTFRVSYGHARHVFMHNIGCQKCHASEMHKFDVDSAKCQKCHVDKLVHGMGTAGLYCLNCHGFGESGSKMTSSRRCFTCHKDMPEKGVMSNVECHECHHPHNKFSIESKDCLGECHSSETRVGQHRKHLELPGMMCLECHKPHVWEVKKANAKGLCDRCHEMKDPRTFIY